MNQTMYVESTVVSKVCRQMAVGMQGIKDKSLAAATKPIETLIGAYAEDFLVK